MNNCAREKELEEMTKEELIDRIKAARQCADIIQHGIDEKNELIKDLSEENSKLHREVNSLIETLKTVLVRNLNY